MTYALAPLVGAPNGSTLTGFITMDNINGDGRISNSEITAWGFSATAPFSFAIGSSGAGARFSCGLGDCFDLQGGRLGFIGSIFNTVSFAQRSVGFVAFSGNSDGAQDQASWTGSNTSMADFASMGSVASALGAQVPEPSSFALAGVAIAACFGARGRQRRPR